MWSDPQRAQHLGKQKASLEAIVDGLANALQALDDGAELLELAAAEEDAALVNEVVSDLDRVESTVAALEFRRMFSGEMDANNAFLDIQSGSGGTEAQDWAEMLLRMYLRWGERQGFQNRIDGGIGGRCGRYQERDRQIRGEYAFGWLRTETGVHRLVRKSPFDSGNRRHTSFAAVFVSPEDR